MQLQNRDRRTAAARGKDAEGKAGSCTWNQIKDVRPGETSVRRIIFNFSVASHEANGTAMDRQSGE